jgi:predicted HicB family RNase H-like nuclease
VTDRREINDRMNTDEALRSAPPQTFDTQLRIGMPSEVVEAIASAAGQRLESLNAYARRALLA